MEIPEIDGIPFELNAMLQRMAADSIWKIILRSKTSLSKNLPSRFSFFATPVC